MESLRSMAIENIKKGYLTIEYAEKMIESNKKSIVYWNNHSWYTAANIKTKEAETCIKYFEIVIEILKDTSDKVYIGE